MRTLFSMILAAMMLTGCSSYAASRYSISADNVRTLREYRGQTVNVGPFTATESKTEITCRAVGPIKTPDGESFEAYVRKAFIDELTIAEVFAPGAPVTIVGNLDSVDFSSNSGVWKFGLTLTSSNGQRLSVTDAYGYGFNFVGEVACNQTAHALMPAVQNLVAKTVRHHDFRALIEPKAR
jgi:hypothetical protein